MDKLKTTIIEIGEAQTEVQRLLELLSKELTMQLMQERLTKDKVNYIPELED